MRSNIPQMAHCQNEALVSGWHEQAERKLHKPKWPRNLYGEITVNHRNEMHKNPIKAKLDQHAAGNKWKASRNDMVS
jgi:hypothetical protein